MPPRVRPPARGRRDTSRVLPLAGLLVALLMLGEAGGVTTAGARPPSPARFSVAPLALGYRYYNETANLSAEGIAPNALAVQSTVGSVAGHRTVVTVGTSSTACTSVYSCREGGAFSVFDNATYPNLTALGHPGIGPRGLLTVASNGSYFLLGGPELLEMYDAANHSLVNLTGSLSRSAGGLISVVSTTWMDGRFYVLGFDAQSAAPSSYLLFAYHPRTGSFQNLTPALPASFRGALPTTGWTPFWPFDNAQVLGTPWGLVIALFVGLYGGAPHVGLFDANGTLRRDYSSLVPKATESCQVEPWTTGSKSTPVLPGCLPYGDDLLAHDGRSIYLLLESLSTARPYLYALSPGGLNATNLTSRIPGSHRVIDLVATGGDRIFLGGCTSSGLGGTAPDLLEMNPSNGVVHNLSLDLPASYACVDSLTAYGRNLFVTGGVTGLTGVIDGFLVPA